MYTAILLSYLFFFSNRREKQATDRYKKTTTQRTKQNNSTSRDVGCYNFGPLQKSQATMMAVE